MKAIVLQSKDTSSYEEIPDPRPPQGWLTIEVHSAGLCGSDIQKIAADDPSSLIKTNVLGHEISGTVTSINGNSDSIKVGDRVAAIPLVNCKSCRTCATGRPHLCENMRSIGKELQGGFAEKVIVPIENARKIPDTLSFDLGAIADVIAVAVHTYNLSGTPEDKHVLIIGDGPLALSCIPIYRERNTVLIRGKHQANLKIAESMGARQIQDLVPESFDIIIECVGRSQHETLRSATHAARRGGKILVTGVFVPQHLTQIDARQLFMKEATLQGVNSYKTGDDDDFDMAMRIMERHREQYEKLITHTFPLKEFQRGVLAVSNRQQSGAIKVVYHP